MSVVRVLIVEDEHDKSEALAEEVVSFFGENARIIRAATFGEATRMILLRPFDLIVVDLVLPRRNGDDPTDVSEELVEHLSESELNRDTVVVAVSRYPEIAQARNSIFSKAAIFLISYADTDSWKSCLRVCMQRTAAKQAFDFVVLCALEEERVAFEAVERPGFSVGPLFKIQGMSCRELTAGAHRGVCIVQPRMGLVDAAIISTRALKTFNPRLICMSGICGGFSGEVTLGTLLISDVCWEHQAGKWRGENFEIRSYQESMQNDLRVTLSQLIAADPALTDLASKPDHIQLPNGPAVIRPTVSGSAVIASAEFGARIKAQHGKVAGLDMEVFSLYRAAALHGTQPMCFAAKTVVDFADEAKGDDIHVEGAILSARFVIKAVECLLEV